MPVGFRHRLNRPVQERTGPRLDICWIPHLRMRRMEQNIAWQEFGRLYYFHILREENIWDALYGNLDLGNILTSSGNG